MLPLSEKRRSAYKARLRKREFGLIARFIEETIHGRGGRPRILEFGCGPAGAARALSVLGELTVSDVYRHPLLDLPDGVMFVEADIHQTSFRTGDFDLLVSNHVIEHVTDLPRAFAEMRRIAKPDALFAFCVPTSTWLLLSVPGQLWKKAENVWERVNRRGPDRQYDPAVREEDQNNQKRSQGILSKFRIEGHGCYPGFVQSLRTFRVARWRTFLLDNGFRVVREEPLLCFASSHWPILPVNRCLAKIGLASSYLFILSR